MSKLLRSFQLQLLCETHVHRAIKFEINPNNILGSIIHTETAKRYIIYTLK